MQYFLKNLYTKETPVADPLFNILSSKRYKINTPFSEYLPKNFSFPSGASRTRRHYGVTTSNLT